MDICIYLFEAEDVRRRIRVAPKIFFNVNNISSYVDWPHGNNKSPRGMNRNIIPFPAKGLHNILIRTTIQLRRGSLNSGLFSREYLCVLSIYLGLVQNSLGFDICASMGKPETEILFCSLFKILFHSPVYDIERNHFVPAVFIGHL
jgi:hypothetical protein